MTQHPHIYTDRNNGSKVVAFQIDGEMVTVPVKFDESELIRPTDVSGIWDMEMFTKRFTI